jgi:hypothetical protein
MKKLTFLMFYGFLCFAAFAQSTDMTQFTNEYKLPDNTFADRLEVLKRVRNSNQTGIGEFYLDALRFMLPRTVDLRNQNERSAAEESARILCRGLGAEKYSAAAPEIWRVVEIFDVIRFKYYEGYAMQDAFIALGEVDAREFLPQIIRRLDSYNSQTFTEPETRHRVQRAVVGCVIALRTFRDSAGYRSVFFVSIGSYDPAIREFASKALPNIASDPVDIMIGMIQDVSNNPSIKLEIFRRMLRTNAPESSKAKVAAAALAVGWINLPYNLIYEADLRDMRKSAIDAIRQFGVSDDSVYANLEKSFMNNFSKNNPDYEEIEKTINALAEIRTNEAVELLLKFLRELHTRRVAGIWANKEARLFRSLVTGIGNTGTQSTDVKLLLTLIQNTDNYTVMEQRLASDVSKKLGF